MGSQLQEQQVEWQLESRRFFSVATMAEIPKPEELLDLTCPATNWLPSPANLVVANRPSCRESAKLS
jgi:hypothetical protein